MGDQFRSGGLCSSNSWWGGVAAVRGDSSVYGPVGGIVPRDPLFSCSTIDVGMLMRPPATPFLDDDVQDHLVDTGLIIAPEISQYQEQQMSAYGFTASPNDDFPWSNLKFLFSVDKTVSSCSLPAAAAPTEKEGCCTTLPLAPGMDTSSLILDHHSRGITSVYCDVQPATSACAVERELVLDGPVNVSASAATSASCNDVVDCYGPPFNHDLTQLQQQLMMNSVHPDTHGRAHQIPHFDASCYASMAAGSSYFINSLPQALEENREPTKTCAGSTKRKRDSVATRSLGTARKKNSSPETSPSSAKNPRIEVPSPLPTFNVRKEKLQDRVTALQQLVSPFGKTDTASVLHEAIEYIKFLHDQVQVLSAPYLKTGQPLQNQQNYAGESADSNDQEMDLRSRGLCLVPISSTFLVANEPVSNYWTSIFGGSTY